MSKLENELKQTDNLVKDYKLKTKEIHKIERKLKLKVINLKRIIEQYSFNISDSIVTGLVILDDNKIGMQISEIEIDETEDEHSAYYVTDKSTIYLSILETKDLIIVLQNLIKTAKTKSLDEIKQEIIAKETAEKL